MKKNTTNQVVWYIIKSTAFVLFNWVWFAVAMTRLVNQHDDTSLGIAIAISMFVMLVDLIVVGDVIYDLTMSKKKNNF